MWSKCSRELRCIQYLLLYLLRIYICFTYVNIFVTYCITCVFFLTYLYFNVFLFNLLFLMHICLYKIVPEIKVFVNAAQRGEYLA